MAVKLPVAFLIMALETKVGPPRIRCSSERKLIHGASLALPVDIMAGDAGNFVVLQWKITGKSFLLFFGGLYVYRVYVTIWSL